MVHVRMDTSSACFVACSTRRAHLRLGGFMVLLLASAVYRFLMQHLSPHILLPTRETIDNGSSHCTLSSHSKFVSTEILLSMQK